jgi:hypothetical protein
MSSCLIVGFFNLGDGPHIRYHFRPSEPGSDSSPVVAYAHYRSYVTDDERPLCPVSIRAHAPLPRGLFPANAFALVIGRICLRGEGQRSWIDALHMRVIPAEAGPPLSQIIDLFPPFPSGFIACEGRVVSPHYRLSDHTCVFPVAVSERVRGGRRTFRVGFVH